MVPRLPVKKTQLSDAIPTRPVLLARMLLTTVTVPAVSMAPPAPPPALLPALLLEKVLLVTVRAPPEAISMAPPLTLVLLPERVQLVTVAVPPKMMMAPPSKEELPEKVLFVT